MVTEYSIPKFTQPVPYWWTRELFPFFCCLRWCCHKYLYALGFLLLLYCFLMIKSQECAYSSSYLGVWGGRITGVQEEEVAVSWNQHTLLQPCYSETLSWKTKKKNETHSNITHRKVSRSKILWGGQAWWLMPVIPALWETKVGGYPETSLANMVKPHLFEKYKS